MRLRELRKYQGEVVRMHLRRGIGDVMGRQVALYRGADGIGPGMVVLRTPLGNIKVDIRTIESASACRHKKLSWGG